MEQLVLPSVEQAAAEPRVPTFVGSGISAKRRLRRTRARNVGRQAESNGKQVAEVRNAGTGGGSLSENEGGGRPVGSTRVGTFRQLRTKWRAKAAKKAAGRTTTGKTRSLEDVKVVLGKRLRRRRYKGKMRRAHEKLKASRRKRSN